jgi:hypothetical protein
VGKSSANPAHLAQRPHRRWLTNYSAIDVHPSWVFTTGSAMADGGRGGVVGVVKPRYRSRGLCTCGWVTKRRLLLSSAEVEALIHAARHDCGVPGVDCRRGCSGQPPQIARRRGLLRAPRRHQSSNRRRRAVSYSTANRLQLIDTGVRGNLFQLTDTHCAGELLQLTDPICTGNVIASGRDCQPHDWVVTVWDIHRRAPLSESQG